MITLTRTSKLCEETDASLCKLLCVAQGALYRDAKVDWMWIMLEVLTVFKYHFQFTSQTRVVQTKHAAYSPGNTWLESPIATIFFMFCRVQKKNRRKLSKCWSCVICIDEFLASSDLQVIGKQVEENEANNELCDGHQLDTPRPVCLIQQELSSS